jgi:RHS repeat-associated protein
VETGRYRDSLTGLQYNHARWYDPKIGRWLSEDPIGFEGDDANLSRYVENAPTMYVDPDGLQTKLIDLMEEMNQEHGIYQRPAEAAGSIGPVLETTGEVIAETNPISGTLLSECRIFTGYDPLRDERVSNAARTGEALWTISSVTIGAVIAKIGQKTVYRSVNAAGEIQYVGITNNLARRAAEQLRTRGIQVEKLTGALNACDARAVEQALIEIHGLGKNGGTLLNRINSISRRNPAYAFQLKRGLELLQSVGY